MQLSLGSLCFFSISAQCCYRSPSISVEMSQVFSIGCSVTEFITDLHHSHTSTCPRTTSLQVTSSSQGSFMAVRCCNFFKAVQVVSRLLHAFCISSHSSATSLTRTTCAHVAPLRGQNVANVLDAVKFFMKLLALQVVSSLHQSMSL